MPTTSAPCCIATIAHVDDEGRIRVRLDDGSETAALCAGHLERDRLIAAWRASQPVLVMVADGTAVLLALLCERVPAVPDRLRLEARDAIELVCGQAGAALHRDGTVVIEGTDVTSCAARTQHLLGGSVLIN